MKSFQAAFRSVYEKGLMQYGFRKVKGKYPYYARCIGDEIVHVITFWEVIPVDRSRPGVFEGVFEILFGVATVYREKIAFDEPQKWNREWLNGLSTICYRENDCPYNDQRAYEEMIPRWFTYTYNIGLNEDLMEEIQKAHHGIKVDSMMEEIEKSFELTEKYAIPVLDGIKTLEDCMNHYFKYRPAMLWIEEVSDDYVMGRSGEAYNEGLLSTVIYGKDRFEEYKVAKTREYEKSDEDELYRIKAGLSGLTMEEYENNKKEMMVYLDKKLCEFSELTNPEWQEKIRGELETRKKNNTDILRHGGFDI